MTKHKTGTRDEWLAARLDLLKAEKELTRRSDELAQRRQELPWVKVDKDYRFETDAGSASLTDLFRGRSQLLVYHFMFGPDYKAGCPSCSAIADGFNGIAVHLANHDVDALGGVAGAAREAATRTSSAWDGRFPGRLRPAATSMPTSTSGSPRSNSARAASNTITGASRDRVARRRSGGGAAAADIRGHGRNRRRHLSIATGRA